MTWLAAREGLQRGTYHKPSPVHALAAAGAALSGQEHASLEAALTLVNHCELGGPLAALRDGAWSIVVFEDSAGGLRSGREAVEILRMAGVDAAFRGIGIATEESKRAALGHVTHEIVSNVNEAIRLALNGSVGQVAG